MIFLSSFNIFCVEISLYFSNYNGIITESMLKLKYILQLFDGDYTLVCAGCENAGQI